MNFGLKNLAFFAMLIGTLFLVGCSSDDDTMEPEVMEDPIVGDWTLAQTEAALAVGPAVGSADWWFNTTADVGARSCLFDDVWTFAADGTFSLSQGGSTWLETWQGVGEEACGTPVAPHNDASSFTYTKTDTEITLNGSGAFLGLAKAINGAELSAEGVAVPASRTYSILEFNGTATPKTMKIGIPVAGDGNWTFIFVSK